MSFLNRKVHNEDTLSLSPILKMREDLSSSEQGHVSMKDILEMSKNEGGDKILIAALSLIVILPFGAVPGVPAIAGVVLALLFLNELLWFYDMKLPRMAERLSIKRQIALKVVCGIDRCFAKVENHIHEDRLSFLNSRASIRVIALLGLILSLAMVLIGFIPFVPTVLMLPILMFSIGLLAKDGLFVAFGYGIVALLAAFALIVMV